MARPTMIALLGASTVTTKVLGAHIMVGNQEAFGAPSPARATIIFDNSLREFDPTYGSATYLADLGGNFSIGTATGDYFAGVGEFNRWTIDWYGPDYSTATLETYCSLASLSRQAAVEPAGGTLSAGSALDNAASTETGIINSVNRGSDAGVTSVNDVDTGDNLLTYARNVVEGEIGWLLGQSFEGIAFISRNFRWAPTLATFTDAPATDAEFDYETVSLFNELDAVYGGVRAQRDGGVEQRWPDTGYVLPELSLGGLVLADDDQVLDAAKQRYEKVSQVRFDQLTINADTVNTAQMWALVDGLWAADDETKVTVGARVTVVKTPTTGGAITRDCFVEGYEMKIPAVAEGAWLVTFYLSDAEIWPAGALILDDATYGVLNDDILG